MYPSESCIHIGIVVLDTVYVLITSCSTTAILCFCARTGISAAEDRNTNIRVMHRFMDSLFSEAEIKP
jgi:hypothetical protein